MRKPRILFWTGKDPQEHQPVVSALAKTYDVQVASCIPQGDLMQTIDQQGPFVGCVAHYSLGRDMKTMTAFIGAQSAVPIIEIREHRSQKPRVAPSYRACLLEENRMTPEEAAAAIRKQLSAA